MNDLPLIYKTIVIIGSLLVVFTAAYLINK